MAGRTRELVEVEQEKGHSMFGGWFKHIPNLNKPDPDPSIS